MATFTVLIPTNVSAGQHTEIKVKADAWMDALRLGLKRIGENLDVQSLICDLAADGMHVTEPKSGRVFLIKEEGKSGQPPPEVHIPSGAPPVKGHPVEEEVTHHKGTKGLENIGRVATPERPVEDILGDLIGRVSDIFEHKDKAAAARFVLDLAMEAIPADSGSVLLSETSATELRFVAAKGPKAAEVMKLKLPIGKGIVGFSFQQGVGLAISECSKDERFHAQISKQLGYPTHSILCAPCQVDGRVLGAIELVNRKGGASFAADEVTVLMFLAHQLAEYLIDTDQAGE